MQHCCIFQFLTIIAYQMKMSISYDSLGIVTSTLYMIHCIGTPFIFIAKACSTSCCAGAPLWWQLLDYFFLVICFFAIYFTSKNSSLNWLKITFWISWSILFLTLINQSLEMVTLPSNFIYVPSALIIIFHSYNLIFCKNDEDCCHQTTK